MQEIRPISTDGIHYTGMAVACTEGEIKGITGKHGKGREEVLTRVSLLCVDN